LIKLGPHARALQILTGKTPDITAGATTVHYENNMLFLVISECWVGVDWKYSGVSQQVIDSAWCSNSRIAPKIAGWHLSLHESRTGSAVR